MKRYLWNGDFSDIYSPPYPCPHCRSGQLRLVPKSLIYSETIASRRMHGTEDWDPQQIELVFTAWLKCEDPKCGQQVAVAGVGGMEPEYDHEDGSYSLEERFYPRVLSPMPDVIELPAKCPPLVAQELRAAFALIWQDRASAAGRIRVSLERLMDFFGVKQRAKSSKGTFFDLSLHARLELFGKKNALIRDNLIAIKWLGNTGSHEADISLDDLLSGLDILEHALAELIDRRTARIAELAKKLTQKHSRRHIRRKCERSKT